MTKDSHTPRKHQSRTGYEFHFSDISHNIRHCIDIELPIASGDNYGVNSGLAPHADGG
jgi:hypothetical protein